MDENPKYLALPSNACDDPMASAALRVNHRGPDLTSVQGAMLPKHTACDSMSLRPPL